MKKPADIKDVWFILPDGTNIFDSEFRAGALSVARELALPKVRLSNETLLLKKFSIEKSGKNSAMAVIAHVRKPALLKAFGKSGIPLVLLGEEAVEDWRKAFGGPITVCSVDNESIGQMAADYLHEQGRFASYIYATPTAPLTSSTNGGLRGATNLSSTPCASTATLERSCAFPC